MPNTRLKRLLDKKKNASMMPKAKLAELEDEYIELLSRIENERKKLGIDDESIRKMKEEIEQTYGSADCRKNADKDYIKQITAEEKAIDKAGRNGDLDDLEYHKNILIALWQAARTAVNAGKQISLF